MRYSGPSFFFNFPCFVLAIPVCARVGGCLFKVSFSGFGFVLQVSVQSEYFDAIGF